MTVRERLLFGLPRVLSTAIASSVFAFVALTMLSVGLRGTGFGGPVVSALWPGMAAITALLLAVALIAVHAVLLSIRMPAEMRAALAAVRDSSGAALPERPVRPWEQAQFRARSIGGFGLPLGLLLLVVGCGADDVRMLWVGGALSVLGVLLLVLASWVQRRIRLWRAAVDRERVRRSYAAGGAPVRIWSEADPYQPFEQLSELVRAAPAKVVSVCVVLGFAGLVGLVVFNIGGLGNGVGYSPHDLAAPPLRDAGAQSVVQMLLFGIGVAFTLALAVAVSDVVRNVARSGEHPLAMLAHPIVGLAVACIAVGFAFVLVWPGQVPLGSTEVHLQAMRAWWALGAGGVVALVVALVFGVAGARRVG